MANLKNSANKKIERNLFLSSKDITENFSDRELERKKRVMLCVSKKLDDPLISDKALVEFLMNGCDGACNEVSTTTAYRDISLVTSITGKVNVAAKEWLRYMVIEGAKAAAKKAHDAGDFKAVASNLTVIMKTGKLEQDDMTDLHGLMSPPDFEPTGDMDALGDEIEKLENPEEERRKLRELFQSKAKEQSYIDYQNVDHDKPQ